VGLAELRRSGALAPGDRVLMITAGVGFSCGAILLQIQP
jgi:3-oxoacyl-[acyl-carrier-protein] synthase III